MQEQPRFEVTLYQLAEDAAFKAARTDGTGFEWGWADLRRDWMEQTASKFAYRCLPLTIANQTGWWVRNPVGFTATWRGVPDVVDFDFDSAGDFWRRWISAHFGYGIITWNTPFLFRTRPAGSRLLVCGPPNYFKDGVQALTGIIESDWIPMSFTMNWKILAPRSPVRFEMGEPILQAIPIATNVCADLERADVVLRKLDDDPEVARAYRAWVESRNKFHALQAAGADTGDGWQKHYFRGFTVEGEQAPTEHAMKVKPPEVRDERGKPVPPSPDGPVVAEWPSGRRKGP